MKKIVRLLAVACMLSTASLFAQDMTYGVKGGINFATFEANTGDINSIAGINVGGFVDYAFTEKFSIQPELLFSMQGGAQMVEVPFFNFELKIETNLTYLNVPIMAKYKLTDKFSALFGPQIGFLIAAKTEGEDIIDNFNRVDVALNFGGTYELPSGIFFEGRYSLGLSNLVKSNNAVDNEGNSTSDNFSNRVLMVGLGYRF